MADIQCLNPVCRRSNPDTKTFCVYCGWRLPRQEAPVIDDELVVLRAQNLQLQKDKAQLLSDQQTHQQQLALVADAHQQLQTQHDQLSSTHQDLTEQHGQVAATLNATQQQLADAEELKQKAETQVVELKAQIDSALAEGTQAPTAAAEITRLGGLLAIARKDLEIAKADVQKFRETSLGKDIWPLRSRILSWALTALVGLGSGTAVGIYSPFKSPKKPDIKTQNALAQESKTIADVQAQLAKAKQDLGQAMQDQVALQQTNAQLTTQVESLNKGSQSASKQAATVQAQLSAAKSDVERERAGKAEFEQQLASERTRNQQLSEKAARVAALEAIIAQHPSLNYKGPTQGTIVIRFNGKSDKPSTIIMDHLNTSPDPGVRVDSVSGTQMPSIPVIVEPVTRNVSIASPPNPANGWQKMTLNVQGKGSNQAVLKWSVF